MHNSEQNKVNDHSERRKHKLCFYNIYDVKDFHVFQTQRKEVLLNVKNSQQMSTIFLITCFV